MEFNIYKDPQHDYYSFFKKKRKNISSIAGYFETIMCGPRCRPLISERNPVGNPSVRRSHNTSSAGIDFTNLVLLSKIVFAFSYF